ncbi:factor-independent urate hydroxylase [Paenibacillus albus]|uniref:Urate oxidase n=1 Tax=Paenibacillus albus TaxID=2495582 RepID=A0A3S9A7H6_9BACL|nr:urate oxidase [Paenibacillus albus]AZN41566.1 urate oxidase [Paenibacillus albus]
MKVYPMEQIKDMNEQEFVDAFGGVFEHSPWVAERAWKTCAPFDSLMELYSALITEVKMAPLSERIGLLRAHPDLAGKLKMSEASASEQQGAGLKGLSSEELAAFSTLNKLYTEKFKFPFIMAVRGHTTHSIYSAMQRRLNGSPEEELMAALREVGKIALFRLRDLIEENDSGRAAVTKETPATPARTMYYGKGDVLVYRTFAAPQTAVSRIPESCFTGQDNVIFAMNVKVAVCGDAFLPSFTEGDNAMVVATDSMKNLILRHAADYRGSTVEGFLYHICGIFLHKYPQMTSIEISADRIPFEGLQVPCEAGGFAESGLIYRRSYNDHSSAALEVTRGIKEKAVEIVSHQCSLKDLQLIKVKGSSFSGFVRDEYTTLPESSDRPLFIWLNIGWTYKNPDDAIKPKDQVYAASEQIRDIAQSVFHEVNSPSIQHLIYRIGLRILSRFPQLDEIRFESNNRTWETIVESIPDSNGRIYTEPRPPYGFQCFTMTHADLPGGGSVL